MLHGLDLFSGIGGITLALAPWVRPVAYCEIDSYPAGVLLSRMAAGELPPAPVWDDVSTLHGADLPHIDIIYGGFPCQDISTAGRGAGIGGHRSGLFFEILRLADELHPTHLFLENVPAIRTRGGEAVGQELARRGFDCAWQVVSAAEVGAPHLRKRWWLLATHSDRFGLRVESGRGCRARGCEEAFPRVNGTPWASATAESRQSFPDPFQSRARGVGHCLFAPLADGTGFGRLEGWPRPEVLGGWDHLASCGAHRPDYWAAEPDVDRVVNGLPRRVDRIKCLGNAVVPLQAREAFQRLAGL